MVILYKRHKKHETCLSADKRRTWSSINDKDDSLSVEWSIPTDKGYRNCQNGQKCVNKSILVFHAFCIFYTLLHYHQIQWYHLLFIIYIRNSNHSILIITSIKSYSTNRSSNSTINPLWFISHHSFNHHFHLLVNWFHSIHIQISFHLFHILVHYHQ